MPHVSDAYPSKYLKTADLNGGSLRARIVSADIESVGYENERKLVLNLEGGKKFILNKTNARFLAKHYGDNTDNWANAEIELYATPVDFQGRAVEATRVGIPRK
jgi:hypothetical protein